MAIEAPFRRSAHDRDQALPAAGRAELLGKFVENLRITRVCPGMGYFFSFNDNNL
jgi:hypothetical protein